MRTFPQNWKKLAGLMLAIATAPGVAKGDATSDVMVGYSGSWRAGMGGTDQTKAAIYNQFAGANNIAAASGSPHRMNVIGTKESVVDCAQIVNCGDMCGWLRSYHVNIRDVADMGNALGADLFTYIGDMADNGAAAQAEQPGRFSCYEQQWFWQNVVAHETGGHNYGCDHAVGHAYPTTIMLHNYCGGSQPYFSNPNIWLNGAQLLGNGSCIGYLAQGGDAAYHLSTSAQGQADIAARAVFGSNLYPVVKRWQFNKPAGAAPAGTVIDDDIVGTDAIVRGQGATFTGTGLRLPGGTSGNTAANSIAAYLDLPNGTFSSMPNFTVEIWATPLSAKNWMRVLEIGNTIQAGDGLGAAGEYTGQAGSPAPGTTEASDVIGLSAVTWSGSLNNQRLIAGADGTHQTADSTLATTASEMHHYAITFADTTAGGTVKWFRDGVLIKTLDVTFHSAALQDVNVWLGRSLWSGDEMAHMDYHDVRIIAAALADGQVAGNYRIGPHDAKSTLWASDGYGGSGFVTGAWEFGGTPLATRDYETGALLLRTPLNANNITFPGKSLTITSGALHLNATGAKTTTINDLRLNGGTVGGFGENGTTQTLAGNINVRNFTDNHIRAGWGPMVISANISGGVGGGGILYTENPVTLTGNNTGYLGATIIGDGRFSTLKISNETNLGGNPTYYGGGWLQLNRGILETTQTMTIDDANRGVLIGPSGGFFRPAAGTTLTIASTLNSPAAGNTLQTTPLFPNPVVGIFFKDGAGTLVLTNPNNSYIGEMQVNQGELRLDGAGRLNNGDMHMPLVLKSTLNVNTTADQIFGGVISGAGTFIKNNTGTTTFYAANTFTGSVTINGGTAFARAANAANNRNFSFVSGITVNNGATLKSQSNSLFGWDGSQAKPITVNAGGTLTTDAANADVNVGTVTLNGGTLAGATSPAWGSWNFKRVTGGKLVATGNSTVTAVNVGLGANNTVEVAAGKTLTFSGTITDLTNEGVCALVKSNGTGTLVLSNSNTYTGPTTINAGTLHLTGSLAAGSSVTVASGATLSGTGTVNGSLSFATGAIHSPGNPAGTQAVNGTLAYASNSGIRWTLASNSDSTGVANRVSAGTVNVTTGAVINLTLNAAGSTVNFTDGFWTQPRTWNVMSASNKSGDFSLGTITTDAGGRSAGNYGTFSLQQSATGVNLVFTPNANSPTDVWRQTHFGAQWNNSAISGDAIDGDNDGLNNLLEYALGSDPNAHDPSAFPQVSTAGNKLRISFRRNVDAADITISVVAADDLAGPWTTIASSTNGGAFAAVAEGATVQEQGAAPLKSVQAEDIYLIPDLAHPKRFMRLEVHR